ncbi:MAG: phosphomannomutase/phosphoglucomutase [Candidatus Altiarchaeia archaeon]
MSIYRAYDIRGVYEKDLTDAEAEKIGKAYATYVGGGDIAVGRDCRLSSPSLRNALVKGLVSAGCTVTDVGMVPTPLLYYTIQNYKKDGGIMITGSHNGPQYNGFKLCKGTDTLYGDQIQEVAKIVSSGIFREGKGIVIEKNVVEDYVKSAKEKIRIKKKIKVVVDGGNGAGGIIGTRLLKELGCEVVELYCEPDGRFPHHFPDPTVDANLKDLIETVKNEKADLGIAYDGDADRLGVVDDMGDVIRGDQSLILFSREILKEKKGATIIFEVKCSQALVEDIKKNGGEPLMYRTGHSFIKKKMKETKAPLAGEMSGHFFFADKYYGYDDGIYSGLRMAELLSEKKEKLSEIMAKIPRYYSTPEIRVHAPEDKKFAIVKEVTEKFQKEKYEVITVDGARMQFPDGWGLIRASNTEPALILRFEAKTPERLKEIEKTIKGALAKYPELEKEL